MITVISSRISSRICYALCSLLLFSISVTRVIAQYSDSAFTLKKYSDLYDERGFYQNKAITVDGKLIISNSNGNVSYSYPISDRTVSGYPLRVNLNYCGSVSFTAYKDRTDGSDRVEFGGIPLDDPYSQWRKFHQNRPAWLLGVNGFAVQAIATTQHLHSDFGDVLTSSPNYYDDQDLIWTIDGYDVCNRMLNFFSTGWSGEPYRDVIRLLRDDGSVLELVHVLSDIPRYPSGDPILEKMVTGEYVTNEANAHGYALVELDSTYYPWYIQNAINMAFQSTGLGVQVMPRKVRYYPGDGLEYVFREWIIPYGMQLIADSTASGHDHGLHGGGPSIFYLDEINSSVGQVANFKYSRQNLPGHHEFYWPESVGYPDSTKGRALLTEVNGHKFEYGDSWMSIEALGRTTIVRFDQVVPSGETVANEKMPFATLGYLSQEAQVLANEPDDYSINGASAPKSFLGLVTKIIDPEGRTTTFDYKPYSVNYKNWGFPRAPVGGDTVVTVHLRNYRMTRVVEPTVRYDICYYIDSTESTVGSAPVDCGTGTEPEVDVRLNPDVPTVPFALSNYTAKVEKSDCNGLLTTDNYYYQFLDDVDSKYPVSCTIVTHDHKSDSTRSATYTYGRSSLGVTSLLYGDPKKRFTSLTQVKEGGSGTYKVTTTSYDSIAPFLRVPSLKTTSYFVGGLEFPVNRQELFYSVFPNIHPFEDSLLNVYFGADIHSEQTLHRTTDSADQIMRLDLVHYDYLPRGDTVYSSFKRWNKLATLKNLIALIDSGEIPIDSAEFYYYDPRVAVYDSVDVTFPPVDRLVQYRATWHDNPSTQDPLIKQTTAYNTSLTSYLSYDSTAFMVDTLPPRGRPVADTIISSDGSRRIVTSRYTNRFLPGEVQSLPASVTNANGARHEVRYRLAGDVAAAGTYVAPEAQIKFNTDSTASTTLASTEYFARIFEQPMLERQLVRKYDPSGTVYVDTLSTISARTWFGLPSAVIDQNGWLTELEYDRNGRLKTAWLPFDFPTSTTVPLSYYSTPQFSTHGWTLDSSYVRSDSCSPQGRIDSIGGVQVSYVWPETSEDNSQLRAARFVWPDSVCPGGCGGSVTVKKNERPSIQHNCYQRAVGVVKRVSLGKIDFGQPFANVSSLDSLYILLTVVRATGSCVTLNVDVDGQSYTKTFTFNCSGGGSGVQTLTERTGDTPPMMPLLVAGTCDVAMTTVESGTRLRVDLTPIKSQLISAGALSVTLSTPTVGGEIIFANDARDARPTLGMKGTFVNANHAGDYTLQYRYSDDSLKSSITAKVDDSLHTANRFDYATIGGAQKRYTTTQHFFGADFQLKRSVTSIGPWDSPFRYDTVNIRNSGLGQKLTLVDQVGDSVQTRYDVLGRPVEIVNADGTRSRISYRPTNGTATYSGSNGPITSFSYENDSLRGIEDMLTGFLMVKTTTREDGISISQYYDARDRLQMEIADTAGLKLTTTYDYDILDRLVRVINPNWDTTTYTYDDFGRIRSKSHPDLGTVSYAYDNVGNVRFSQTQLQADSNRLTFTEYDDLNRPTVVGEVEITDELPSPGDRWTDLLDPTYLHDNGKSALLTANKTLWSLYQSVWSNWSLAQLDSLAGCSLSADTLLLGESNPPVEPLLRHPAPVHSYAIASSDTAGFEDAKNVPGGVRMMVFYDELPQSIGMWMDFPAAEQWDSLAPHGKVRNLRGREAVTAYREHANQPFHYTVLSYDERGRVEALLRYTENLGFDAVYYSYNSMNQVTAVRVADPLRQYTTWYGYDYNGRVDSVWTKLQSVGSGLDVSAPTYPHTANRPNDPDIVYSYTKTGQVDTMRYPLPDVYVAYSYTKRKWLDSIQAWQQVYTPFPVLSSVFTEALSYDSTGQILQQQWKHAGQGPQQQDYVYDAVQRLVGWKNGSGDSSFYQYDNIGNRNYSGSVGSVTASSNYSYDRASHGPDQMQSLLRNDLAGLVQSDYSYSADGAVTGRTQTNMTNGGQITRIEGYSQSYRGLLTGYTLNDVPNARTEAWGYHYNAMGEREQKRLYDMQGIVEGWDGSKPWVYYLLGGNREQFAVYHGREQLAFSCGEPGPGVAFYPVEYNTFGIAYPGVMETVAFVTTEPHPTIPNGVKYYKITDHLSSTRVSLDGATTRTWDYDPWGKVIASTGTTEKHRQGYNGQEDDRESDLFNLGVRKYDDEDGRMTSVDPLWQKFPDQSPYVYSNNNPVNMTDPTGMQVGMALHQPNVLSRLEWDAGGGGAGAGAGIVILGVWIAQQIDKLLHSEDYEQPTPEQPAPQQETAKPAETAPSPGEMVFPDEKELAKQLGVTVKEYHDNVKTKEIMKDADVAKAAKKIGAKNPDIGYEKGTRKISLKNRDNGKTITIDVVLDAFKH